MSNGYDKVTSDKPEVTMWKCDCCGINITYYDENGDLCINKHYDITQSRKYVYVCCDGVVTESLDDRDVNMQRLLCEACFINILQESELLRRVIRSPGATKNER